MGYDQTDKRYHNMLASARARGNIPPRIPLVYGKPASKNTLMELFTSGKLSPVQMGAIAEKLFPKEEKPKQEKKRSTITKVVAKVQHTIVVNRSKR